VERQQMRKRFNVFDIAIYNFFCVKDLFKKDDI